MSYELIQQIIRETLLQEGVYDPGIFKAVFMAGGPGSGKSHTAKKIFGADPAAATETSTTTGLKLVNSDPAFEYFLKQVGISPSSLGSMPPEEFKKVTVGPESPRMKAKNIRDKQQAMWMRGKLGVVIDGTGDNYEKIKHKKLAMQEAGYDTYMIFVNTTLGVAQERNANRERKLPATLVEQVWEDVQKNLGKFQALFGAENMVIIDNTEYGPVPGAIEKAVKRFLNQPIRNPVGKEWIESELAIKGPKAKRPKAKS